MSFREQKFTRRGALLQTLAITAGILTPATAHAFGCRRRWRRQYMQAECFRRPSCCVRPSEGGMLAPPALGKVGAYQDGLTFGRFLFAVQIFGQYDSTDHFLRDLRAMAESMASANKSLLRDRQTQDLQTLPDKRLIFGAYDSTSHDLDWWSVSGIPNTGPGGSPATTIYRQLSDQQAVCVNPHRWAYYDSGVFRFSAHIAASSLFLTWEWSASVTRGVGCF